MFNFFKMFTKKDDFKKFQELTKDIVLMKDFPKRDIKFNNLMEKVKEGKVNINAQSNTGITPLMLFAKMGNKAYIDKMITAGANCNSKDNDGLTPLLHYVKGTFSYFSSDDEKYRPSFEVLINAQINEVDKDGNTALNIAVQNGNTSMAKLLVENGADILKENIAGKCPLYYSVVNDIANSKSMSETSEISKIMQDNLNTIDMPLKNVLNSIQNNPQFKQDCKSEKEKLLRQSVLLKSIANEPTPEENFDIQSVRNRIYHNPNIGNVADH